MNRKQTGFTLIELVVVITILGILAAVALPKFANLQRDAHIAKLNGAKAAVGAASALVHGAYLARNQAADPVGNTPCEGTNLVSGTLCTEAGLVQLANGYPAGATALAAANPGIVGAAGLTTSVFSPTLAQLNAEGFGAAVDAANGVTTISVIGGSGTAGAAGAQVNATCSFTYTAAAANAAPTISATTTTGC